MKRAAGARRGRAVATLVAACAAVLFLRGAASAAGEGFSLHGVRLGMTRAEVAAIWLPLGDGTFAAPAAALKEIEPLFDHEGKLFQLSFTVEVQRPEPAVMVNEAFQGLVERRWGAQKDLGVVVSIGPARHRLTVYHRAMRAAYIRHLEEQIAPLLKP